MQTFPSEFLDRLEKIIPAEQLSAVLASFAKPRPLTVRINLLKCSVEEMKAGLAGQGLDAQDVPWSREALIFPPGSRSREQLEEEFREGRLYRQGLSSLLPVIALNPRPEETVLDLCAAPGSKTTQMAAAMRNTGEITAIEAVRSRYYKLKAVCDILGAENVRCIHKDARRYQAHGRLFDRVLVDAPCSSEARFDVHAPKTFRYWSLRKIREMARKQKGLLLQAGRLLKPGGVLVYSTCSFAPEENEGVVDWFLRKTDGRFRVCKWFLPEIQTYPALPLWQKREYQDQVQNTIRICPNNLMEGFFIAKFEKIRT